MPTLKSMHKSEMVRFVSNDSRRDLMVFTEKVYFTMLGMEKGLESVVQKRVTQS